MSLVCSLYVAILFFLLTPGILLRIPKGGSKYAVAGLHALIFGVVLFLTRGFVWRLSASLEGFDSQTGEPTTTTTHTTTTTPATGSAKEEEEKQ